MAACQSGNVETARVLIDAKANVNAQNKVRRPPTVSASMGLLLLPLLRLLTRHSSLLAPLQWLNLPPSARPAGPG